MASYSNKVSPRDQSIACIDCRRCIACLSAIANAQYESISVSTDRSGGNNSGQRGDSTTNHPQKQKCCPPPPSLTSIESSTCPTCSLTLRRQLQHAPLFADIDRLFGETSNDHGDITSHPPPGPSTKAKLYTPMERFMSEPSNAQCSLFMVGDTLSGPSLDTTPRY